MNPPLDFFSALFSGELDEEGLLDRRCFLTSFSLALTGGLSAAAAGAFFAFSFLKGDGVRERLPVCTTERVLEMQHWGRYD